MTSALVVGEPGCGRTTFVGLLYTAVVRLGTEESDRFRFHAERESIRRLEAIYGALGAGQFPAGDVDREDQPLRFVFGFRRPGFARWGGSNGGDGAEFDAVPVAVGGAPVGEVAELDEHDPVLDEVTRALLRSSVVVPLINAASLRPTTEVSGPRLLERFDRELSRTLEVVLRFVGADRHRRRRRLYPVFVLTQFDRMPAETRTALGIPAGDAWTWREVERAKVGARILRQYLPETAKRLAAGRGSGVAIGPPRWFFSELETELDGSHGLRIRRRSRIPLGGWEPVYPYEEYRGLLLEIGNRAHLGIGVAAD